MRNDQRKELANRVADALPLKQLAFNPFSTGAASAFDVAEDADEGSYEYRMIEAGPPVASDECELPTSAVAVRVLWGRNLLHVAHLKAGASFYVGELEDKNAPCDYFLPAAKLGCSRAPVVLDGAAIVPAGAQARITRGNAPSQTLEQALAAGIATPCVELAGGYAIPLSDTTSVRIELDDVVVELAATKEGKKTVAAFSLAALLGSAFLYVLASFVGHAGLLATVAMLTPPLGDTEDDSMTGEQRYMIQQYLDAAAEKEQEQRDTEQLAVDNPDNDEGGSGVRARDEEGGMGDMTSTSANQRYSIAKSDESESPAISRSQAIAMAQTFGVIGLINAGSPTDPNAPNAPWGGLVSNGNDDISARGNMWGATLGDAYGPGGLGLSGIGEGGGGIGEGIGMGNIGTIGNGSGRGDGQGFGDGTGKSLGRLQPHHHAKAPGVRMAPPSISGRIPPEVIQRIVRQNYGRFRACYETGLRTNPGLQGRVSVAFVIGRDGRVSNVSGGGDMPDNGVVSCIARSFYGLSFPQPDGGIVTVQYPLMLTPGG